MCSINHDKKLIFLHLNPLIEQKVIQILEKKYNFKYIKERRPDHKTFCMEDESTEECNECSEKHNVHICKYDQLLKYYSTSYFLKRISNMNEEKWASYKKICIVRNPYHRLYTVWKFINDDKPSIISESISNLINKKNLNDFDYKNWHTSQSINIFDKESPNKQIIDIIINYDNIDEELNNILNEYGYTEDFSITMKIKDENDDTNKQNNKIFQFPNRIQEPEEEEDDFSKFDIKEFLNLIDNQKILDKMNILFNDDFEKLNYEKITNIKIAKKLNCT